MLNVCTMPATQRNCERSPPWTGRRRPSCGCCACTVERCSGPYACGMPWGALQLRGIIRRSSRPAQRCGVATLPAALPKPWQHASCDTPAPSCLSLLVTGGDAWRGRRHRVAPDPAINWLRRWDVSGVVRCIGQRAATSFGRPGAKVLARVVLWWASVGSQLLVGKRVVWYLYKYMYMYEGSKAEHFAPEKRYCYV